MKLLINKILLLAAGMIFVVSAGCASDVASALPLESSPTAALVHASPSPAAAATRLSKPAVVVAAPINTPTPLPANTSAAAFLHATVKSLLLLSNWQMGLTFEFDQPIEGEYYLKFEDTDIQYDCSPQIAYNHPERLFCTGRQPAMLETVTFTLVEKAGDEPVLQSSIFIPAR